MKRRQGVETLIQSPFPFLFNSRPRSQKLGSLFSPSSQSLFPFRHLLCRLLYTKRQQTLKLRTHLTDYGCRHAVEDEAVIEEGTYSEQKDPRT